jgi:hypothetical protein
LLVGVGGIRRVQQELFIGRWRSDVAVVTMVIVRVGGGGGGGGWNEE